MKLAICLLCALLFQVGFPATQASGTNSQQETLWDQASDRRDTGVPSQVFSDVQGNASWLSADDFTVPKGETWTVNQVTVFGRFKQVPDNSVMKQGIWNVFIFNSASTSTSAWRGAARIMLTRYLKANNKNTALLPVNQPAFQATNLPASASSLFQSTNNSNSKDNSGNFGSAVIDIPQTVTLAPGTYWISIAPTLPQANLFLWQVRNDNNGEPFAIQLSTQLGNCPNNNGAFATQSSCDQVSKIVGDSQDDLAFQISGSRSGQNLASGAATLHAFWM